MRIRAQFDHAASAVQDAGQVALAAGYPAAASSGKIVGRWVMIGIDRQQIYGRNAAVVIGGVVAGIGGKRRGP